MEDTVLNLTTTEAVKQTADYFTVVLGAIAAGFIMPFTQWVKGKYEADLPFLTWAMAAILNFGSAYGLAAWLRPGTTPEEILGYALAGLGTSGAVHALWKTAVKNTNITN